MIEAIGVPATFPLRQDLIAPGGVIANIGGHGQTVDLHLERLWSRNIAITISVPRRHRYYQSAKTSGVKDGITYLFAPPFRLRFSTFAPTRLRFPRRPGPTLSRGTLGYFKVGHSPVLPGSWKIHPLPLPRSRTPVSPDPLAMMVSRMQSPPMGPRTHQRCGNFEAL